MTEMTPERLRECGRTDLWLHSAREIANAAATAWEADRDRLEQQWYNLAKAYRETRERMERYNGRCTILEAHIEALEKERDLYRSNVDRWAEEIAARDTRIEELEPLLVRWLAFAGELRSEWWTIQPTQAPESYTPEGIALNKLVSDNEAALAKVKP